MVIAEALDPAAATCTKICKQSGDNNTTMWKHTVRSFIQPIVEICLVSQDGDNLTSVL